MNEIYTTSGDTKCRAVKKNISCIEQDSHFWIVYADSTKQWICGLSRNEQISEFLLFNEREVMFLTNILRRGLTEKPAKKIDASF
jgi:hypothetical protein